jgi:hypothetical protein
LFHYYDAAPLLVVNAAEIDFAHNDAHFQALLTQLRPWTACASTSIRIPRCCSIVTDPLFATAPERQPAWQALTGLAGAIGRRRIIELLGDEARNGGYACDAPGIQMDFCRQRLDGQALDALPRWPGSRVCRTQIERPVRRRRT